MSGRDWQGLLIFVSAVVVGALLFFYAGKQSIRHEAVERGCAEWRVVDSWGRTAFAWTCGTETKP